MDINELVIGLEKVAVEDITKARVVDLGVKCVKMCDEIYSIIKSERLNDADKIELIKEIMEV